ncbi:UPF0658 Golgi apparatus membrane protein [Mycena venus]|uniref:UPF0658 Golgi apparatus membrane protein n=1 Tax=Mycena venus TaxID=2733690 RepID=A0A8H6XG00_9AGAR|nr:UPF0658 Golgi apparatus membrane protein [Mycena venus]
MASRPFDSSSQSDFKPAYDDDLAFSSYAHTNQHQTFTVGAPHSQPPDHRRNPSFPIHKHFRKNSDDTSNDLVPVAYPPPPPEKEVDSRGFWEKILPESMACRLYVLTVLIETTIDLIIEGELLLQIHKNAGTGNFAEHQMPVYLSIFALAHVFQFVMAVDAVYARNTLQFIALTIFNALFLAYAVIQIGEIRDLNISSTGTIPINVLTTIIPIVIAIAEVAYIALGWKIYDEFGWKVYKFLGADRRIKKMYASYQIYECLVKFDVFFWVGFSVQFIWLVLLVHDWEYYVTCAALPLSLVLLIEGHLAARHENKMMMLTFISGCGGAMIYFVYKLVKVLRYRNTTDFNLVWKTLTIFSVIAIILLVVTFVYSIMVLQNFGRGLKDSLMKKSMSHSRDGSQRHRAASQNPNRMSIN